jgi:hypothetical protein
MTPAFGEAQADRMPPGRPTGSAVSSAPSAEQALRFAQALARACARALGEAVAGVILHGSLTLDDYLPGRSDVDLLVVVDDPLTEAQLDALAEAVAGHRSRAPGPVDLRLVTRQVAASPTPAPPLEAYLRLTPGSGVRLEERRHPGERGPKGAPRVMPRKPSGFQPVLRQDRGCLRGTASRSARLHLAWGVELGSSASTPL